jgi:hypothetical protein
MKKFKNFEVDDVLSAGIIEDSNGSGLQSVRMNGYRAILS